MNAFLDLGARQIPAPVKARERAAATRARKAEEQALAERDALFHLWEQHQREQLKELIECPYGGAVQELLAFLADMHLGQAAALITLVKRGPWRQADDDTRLKVLRLVNAGIIRLREHRGLEPFDDPLFDQPPNVFLVLREWLR